MPEKNTSFTDSDKAKIYVRDRATCCFSGANLWLLDAPLRVGWQSDWADHRKPISRGGKADWEKNGVCASHTYNMKKRNNSADTTYLFENGHPTSLNYMICGAPPSETTDRLLRLFHLEQADWYFNRTITWIFEALNFQWRSPPYKRDDEHWFDAAFKKLSAFRKAVAANSSYRSLEERGIVGSPDSTQKILLSLRDCDCPAEMRKIASLLTDKYTRNSDTWWGYFHPEDSVDSDEKFEAHRHESYEKAQTVRNQIDFETFLCIESDYMIRCTPNTTYSSAPLGFD